MSTVVPSSQELIEQHQGLVRSLAMQLHRKLPPNFDLDDLVSDGQVGLAQAAQTFDPQRGGSFGTYAYYRIRGAICDGLSRVSWDRLRDHQRAQYERMAGEALADVSESSSPNHQPTLDDEVEWLGETSQRLSAVYLVSSCAADARWSELALADEKAACPSETLCQSELHDRLRGLIGTLQADAQLLIQTTYFEGGTLQEAAQRLGKSKSWASRLHSRTLDDLARGLRCRGLCGD